MVAIVTSVPAAQISSPIIGAIFIAVATVVFVKVSVFISLIPISDVVCLMLSAKLSVTPYMNWIPSIELPASFDIVTETVFAALMQAFVISGFANRQLASNSLDWLVSNFLTGVQIKVTPAITNNMIRTVATIVDNPFLLYIVFS